MNRIDNNVSTHTFGTPEPVRSKSQRRIITAESLQVDRPTLIRSQTPQPPAEDQKAIARMFSENMFADPAPQKAYGKFGPKLYTDGHQRLAYMLREECGRLFSFNKSLKEKLALHERSLRMQSETIADLKSSQHAKSERIVTVTNELREAQDALQEMDNMLSETRSKRLSRIGARFDLTSLDLGENLH